MSPASELESDVWAFFLSVIAIVGLLVIISIFRVREKRRASKERRRYREEVREERRRAEEDRRQQ